MSDPVTSFSNRWTHHDSERLDDARPGGGAHAPNQIRRGEVGSWARATTWFKRPHDVAMPTAHSAKITAIRDVAAYHAIPKGPALHNPDSIVIPADSKKVKEVGDNAGDVTKTLAIQASYWERLGLKVDPTKLKTASTTGKTVGVMEYGHKTAGHIVAMTPEQAALVKRKTRRKGYGTCLRFDPKV